VTTENHGALRKYVALEKQNFAVILLFAANYAYTTYFCVEQNQEAIYRVRHGICHYSLLPSFDGIGNWGWGCLTCLYGW